MSNSAVFCSRLPCLSGKNLGLRNAVLTSPGLRAFLGPALPRMTQELPVGKPRGSSAQFPRVCASFLFLARVPSLPVSLSPLTCRPSVAEPLLPPPPWVPVQSEGLNHPWHFH